MLGGDDDNRPDQESYFQEPELSGDRNKRNKKTVLVSPVNIKNFNGNPGIDFTNSIPAAERG